MAADLARTRSHSRRGYDVVGIDGSPRMAASQRPLSAAALTETATKAGWKDLPARFMVSGQDNAIPPDCERFMAKRMNATETVDQGSHAAFVAHPDIAAGLILRAIETT